MTKFDIGQKVVIRKNLGNRFDPKEYYYGGSLKNVPLGTKGVVDLIPDKDKIYITFDPKISSRAGWYVHPNEICSVEDQAKIEREEQEKQDSLLEQALLTDVQVAEDESDSIKQKPFEPKFNTKNEFVFWAREQFPDLKEHIQEGKEYKLLGERIKEVKDASHMTLDWIRLDIANSHNHCHIKFLSPYFDSLSIHIYHYTGGSTTELTECAESLDRLLRALNASKEENFPYNDTAQEMKDG